MKLTRLNPHVLLIFGCLILQGFLQNAPGQTYLDNQTPNELNGLSNSNQDPSNETRRSDHFRMVFGHYNHDTGAPMTEQLAQGNMQQYEQMWNRWVNEMGLHDINVSATAPDGNKYRANFHFLMTWNDGGGGGAYSSMDSRGFFFAMGNPSYCRYDPPSGATPHEFGHVWEGTCGGFNNSDSSGKWWECTANWMLLQFLNSYPQAGGYLYNSVFYPAHGRDYYDSWMIWEAAKDDPRYGAAWVNNVWTNFTSAQATSEYILDRMIRLDSSGSADKAGGMKDLWGDMAKKMVTWDFARQRWLAQANTPWNGDTWEWYTRCRAPLVKMPGTNGWYRPARAHMPMEFGFHFVPLSATPGASVSCNFQPLCDPVRQSDWRACLVAVSTNGNARYSCQWNIGTNYMNLSADETQLYLMVIAVPKPMKIASTEWTEYLTESGLQFPYTVSFQNTGPINVTYPVQSHAAMHQHPNGLGWVANTATVDATAYVGPNAQVLDTAQVRGNARIEEFGVVRNNGQVRDNAVVSGHGVVYENAQAYGNAKVRDWAMIFGWTELYENAKAIEHAGCGGGDSVNHNKVYGDVVLKGVTSVYSPSTFSGSLICDGDTANGGTGDHGVHFGWQWGQNPSIFTGLTDNKYQYCGLPFENTAYGITNNPVFALDQFGINHGYLMNGCRAAVDTGTSVRGGYVLPLNGVNQYVELHNSVNDFKNLSIAVWAKWSGTTADQKIWSMGDGSGKVMYMTPMASDTGKLKFVITDGVTTQTIDGAAALGTGWTHVVVTITSGVGTLYVNGAQVGLNANLTLSPDQLNAPLMENANYLGRGNAGDYFQGSLDEFRLYNKTLSASEVTTLYNTAPPSTVTPVADTTPPSPNAPTWLVSPNAISDSAITMSATPGTDASGWVEYYFACTSGAGHDSGWVSFNKYTDCGLSPGMAYTYTIRMRDANGNLTSASAPASVTTPISSAGTPSFAYGPVGIADGQIAMTATKLTNPSGKVEYKFDRPGKSSGWQASPSWTDTGLTVGGYYTYTVTVQDGWGNASAASAGVTARARDEAAPQLPIQPAHWTMQPYATIDNRVSMTAMDASDPSGVQYYFHCTAGGAPDSGWQDSPTYLTTNSLADGTYSFQYKLRDKSAQTNESAYSTIYTAKITPTTGYHPCTFGQLTTLPDDYLVTFGGVVTGVTSTNYVVRDTNSSATITVWPDTYGMAADPSLIFKTVAVKGHLYTYTNYGGRLVSFAAVTATGGSPFTISGTVTNLSGVPLPGVTVYVSSSANAAANPATSTVTDASGRYSIPVLPGTWYLAAGSAEYYTSADQVVTIDHANAHNVNFGLIPKPKITGQVLDLANGGAPVPGATVAIKASANAMTSPAYTVTTDASGNYGQVVTAGTWYVAAGKAGYETTGDQTLTVNGVVTGVNLYVRSPAPRNIPTPGDLLFAVVADALPPTGSIGSWPIYATTLTDSPVAMSAIGSPPVDATSTRKWEKNAYSSAQGFLVGSYSASIPVNGATIVMAVKPTRNSTSTTTTSCVEIFGTRLSLGLRNNTGRPNFYLNGTQVYGGTASAIASGTTTILSLVVQSTGAYTLYTNGVFCFSGTGTALTSLDPTAGTNIRVGRGDATGSTYNGNLGDVYVYKVALSDAQRQQLEADLTARFAGTPTSYTVTASAGASGNISPSGSVSVYAGANQTFGIVPNSGYGVAGVTVDGTAVGAVTNYTFNNVTAAHTISASFTPLPAYTINASAGTGGSISPAGAVTAYSGGSQTFVITPATGYRINTVTTDGISRGAINTYTFSGITAGHTISATFTSLNRNVPKSDQLLFSVVGDSLPTSGSISSWATLCPSGKTLTAMASPTVQTINSKKWESNLYADGDGFRFGNSYWDATGAHPIPCNGATIVLIAKPTRNAIGTSWISLVDIFYDRLVLGLKNDNGAVVTRVNGNLVNSSATLPDGQPAVLSQVVQPDGNYTVWANGSVVMTGSNAPMTSLVPGVTGSGAGGFGTYVNVGRNNPDGWTTFNGNIGDVFVYTNALADADRLMLETDLSVKFSGATITATAGSNGSISPSGAVTADYGSSKTFTMAPNTGYAVSDVVVDGDSVGAVTSYTFANVNASHTIVVYYATATYTITASAGPNGSISPSGSVIKSFGQSQSYTITPNTGYVANVLVDGVSQGSITSYTFNNISANHTISATFSPIPYTIAATAGPGGTISPAGNVVVGYGGNQNFTITASSLYAISDVTVDGVSQGAISAYTFNNVKANHSIAASFVLVPGPLVDNTGGATNLNVGVAQLHGTLGNGPADVYFYWDTADRTAGGSWANTNRVLSVPSGDFSCNVSNLLYGPTYYYRCYASNQYGVAWAPAATNFTTLRPESTLSNLAADGITSSTATLAASLRCTGAVYNVYAFWNTSDGGTDAASWTNSVYVGAWTNVEAVSISMPVGNLAPGTTYFFTFLATNALDALWATNVLSFATASMPATPPTLTIAANGTGGIEITWPDTYTGALLSSPVLGPDATWSPVGIEPEVSGGFKKVTIIPGPGQRFYGLSQ